MQQLALDLTPRHLCVVHMERPEGHQTASRKSRWSTGKYISEALSMRNADEAAEIARRLHPGARVVLIVECLPSGGQPVHHYYPREEGRTDD